MDTNKWDIIEKFLNSIHKDVIENQKYFLYGHEEGYEKVPSVNLGYLPFYDSKELKVTESIVPSNNTTIRSNQIRSATNYIVIHNTGMAHPSATAKGLDKYIHSTDRQASWHFSVDDIEAFQQIPINEVGWHAGDGSTKYGETWTNQSGTHIGGGNRNGIGIESCVYAGVDFNMVMRNVAKLTSKLLYEFNLGIDDIKQHYDFSGKNCPQVIREANRWDEFIKLVEIEHFARCNLSDVKFSFKSLNPKIIDDKGRVINHPQCETKISYNVEVEHNGMKKVYNYTSTLAKLN